MPHSPERLAPSAPPASRGRRRRGWVGGARRRVGSPRPVWAPAEHGESSPAARGARYWAPDLALRAAAPSLESVSGCALRALSPPHPSDLMQTNLSHRPSPQVAKAYFEVRCTKSAIWTTPARSGEQSAGFKLEKRLLYINHGSVGATRPNVGFGSKFSQLKKDFPSRGPFRPP